MEEPIKDELVKEEKTSEEKKEESKSPLKIVWNIVSWVLVGFCLLFAVSIIVARVKMPNQNSVMSIGGTEMRIVLTGSMEGSDEFYEQNPEYEIKDLPVDTLLFIKKVPYHDDEETQARLQNEFYEDVKEGDILTFYYSGTSYIVTHRVIEKTYENGIYTFVCRGDNPEGDKFISEASPTQTVKSNSGHIIGKVTGANFALGWTIKNVVQNKVVVILVIIVPSFIMMVYEIFKIFYILSEEKKDKINKEEKDKRDAELDELKRQIEELKKEKGG